AVEERRREIGRARSIEPIDPRARMAIERVGVEAVRLVAHAQRLQRDRSKESPAGSRAYFGGEPLRVLEIAPETRLQRRHAVLADQEPRLQGSEAAAERDAPVAIVLHAAVRRGLQVTGIR